MTTGPDSPQQPTNPNDPSQPPIPPGYYSQAPPPPANYVQSPPMKPDEEKLWAIGAHLGPIVLGIIAPLIVWLVFKDRSQYLDRQGKEALNMQISYLIYFAVSAFSLLLLIGFILLPLVGIAWLVLMILATIKAANHEDFRYPAIIRLIK